MFIGFESKKEKMNFLKKYFVLLVIINSFIFAVKPFFNSGFS